MAKEEREEITRFGDIWKPKEKNEELKGVVVSTKTDEKYGFSILVKQDDGKELSTPSHKNLQGTLESAFKSNKIRVNDKVAITYLGMEQVKKAKGGLTDPFNTYKVELVKG